MRVVVRSKQQKQFAKQNSAKSKDDFSLWLKKIPFEFLQDVYRHYRIRRDIPMQPFIDGSIAAEKHDSLDGVEARELSPPMQPIVLRRSVFFLILSLLGIEIFFDLIYGGFRFLLMYVSLTHVISPVTIESLYFGLLVFLNLIKVIFMIVTALEWIGFTYEITGKEIICKYGIFNHKEKVFLCTYVQEVMSTQSLIGKIFNYGTIELHNPTLDEIIYLDSVPNPKKHAETIKTHLPLAGKKEYMPIKMEPAS